MLSGLAVLGAITAALAGLAGAWSPCGFSMVETIGSAIGQGNRAGARAASATFALGALLGGVATFAGLALLAEVLFPRAEVIRDGLGALLALAAAIADWRGVKIAPQIRRQVPEHWRRTQPLAVACGLYGILLGLGFTTFVLAFAVWALAGISLATGDPGVGAMIGVGFGLGRAAPVLLMAPSFAAGAGGRALDTMAREPRMWLGLRRLGALALTLCALLLSEASATAAPLAGAFDPSASGGQLAWQTLAGPAMLSSPSGQLSALPGSYPALGGSHLAWSAAGSITLADSSSLVPSLTIQAPGVNALATSEGWLVYRSDQPGASEQLIAVSLLEPTVMRRIATATLPGELGRPTLSGALLAFSQNTPRASTIESVNLESGARATLRSVAGGAALANPSLLEGRLLYERFDRCEQQLLLGAAEPGAAQRLLMRLPSAVTRDPGYEPGYEHAWNSASVCPNRRLASATPIELGPTALSPSAAYVTELVPAHNDAQIVSLGL